MVIVRGYISNICLLFYTSPLIHMCITPLLSTLPPQGPCCGPSVGDVVLGLFPWPVWLQFVPPLRRGISDTALPFSAPPTHTLCVVLQPIHIQTPTRCHRISFFLIRLHAHVFLVPMLYRLQIKTHVNIWTILHKNLGSFAFFILYFHTI